MIDLSKEIIFRDGIDINDEFEITDEFLENVEYIKDLGKHYGLQLDVFEMYEDLIYFEWRGTKRDMLRFYTYYSKNMTTESSERRKTTQKIILGK